MRKKGGGGRRGDRTCMSPKVNQVVGSSPLADNAQAALARECLQYKYVADVGHSRSPCSPQLAVPPHLQD